MPWANAGFGVGHDNWKFGFTSPREKEGKKIMKMN
tara:strand:+ start:367 stop:471 length:105 start_codon:yes stop_codon:yes gene_type:complete